MQSTVLVTIAALLAASAPASRAQAMPGMDMSAAAGATSGDMMPMAHMTMTKLGPMHAGDEVRAAAIADTLRGAIEKYRDYHVALDDGYAIFLPKIPQTVYHFTSKTNALKAIFTFDPSRFGLRGTIVTEDACNAAGGRWMPTVFGWMVHVSPWEKDPAMHYTRLHLLASKSSFTVSIPAMSEV